MYFNSIFKKQTKKKSKAEEGHWAGPWGALSCQLIRVLGYMASSEPKVNANP